MFLKVDFEQLRELISRCQCSFKFRRYHLHSPELPFGERLFGHLDRFQRHLSNLVDLLDFRKQKEHFLTGLKEQTLFDVNFALKALIFLAVIFSHFDEVHGELLNLVNLIFMHDVWNNDGLY